MSTFQDLPLEIAKIVISRLEDPDYDFNQQEFLEIFKSYLTDKVKTVFYFDSPDAVEHMVNQILLIIGPEQSYTTYQFVLAYISLNI